MERKEELGVKDAVWKEQVSQVVVLHWR